MDATEDYSLTFHSAVANSYFRRVRARGVTELVEEFVDRHPVDKFTSKDIVKWIEVNRPEVLPNIRPSALSMTLRRMFDKERLILERRPSPGIAGVYSRMQERLTDLSDGDENKVYESRELCAGLR